MNEIRLDTKRLDELAFMLRKNMTKIMTDLALEVQAQAQMLAPIETGALINSIYVVTKEKDGYGRASSAVKSKNPTAKMEPLPAPTGNAYANVGSGLEYAGKQEFGGIIRASNGRYLTIPITKEAKMVSARNFPRKLHVQSHGGAVAVLADESGSVQYILKESVNIPAHPYMLPASEKVAQELNSGEMFRELFK